jgi:hypothetical protein
MEWDQVRFVIIKLSCVYASAFHVSRLSARNHLSLLTTTAVRDKLLKYFLHPPRATTYLNQIHASRKENEIREPARTSASRNDVDNDNNNRRTNQRTSRCTCLFFSSLFLPPRLIYSNHSIDTSLYTWSARRVCSSSFSSCSFNVMSVSEGGVCEGMMW